MVSDQSAPARALAARPAISETCRSLCLLRHHGEHQAARTLLPSSHASVAEMARSANALEAAPLGALRGTPGAPSAPFTADHPLLRLCQRSSSVKNRMR